MKLELINHAGKRAGYNLVPENSAEENALQSIADKCNIEENALQLMRSETGKNLQLIMPGYEPHDVKALIKLGEISLSEVKEEPEEYLVCSECGSKNVQVRAWVYPNKNNSYAGEIEDGEAWCENCEEHVDLDLVKTNRRKRKKNGRI